MYDRAVEDAIIAVTDPSVCEETRNGICDKTQHIHHIVKNMMQQVYSIKGILIGNEENENVCVDIPITCLDEELNGIEAKLTRISLVLCDIQSSL